MLEKNSLLVVVVLYRKRLLETPTYQSLKKAALNLNKPINVLVYDNSPDEFEQESENQKNNILIQYFHDKKNSGLCKAYNHGIEVAKKEKIDWLLLLDQDTIIPSNYLESFLNVNFPTLDDNVVCAVPKVLPLVGSKIISPIKIYWGVFFRSFKTLTPGILKMKITGINSGTFLSVKFIDELGGFNSRFPLDMLDHWYFSEISRCKQKVLLLDLTINHNLSVNSFESEVSLKRYESILSAEKIFSQSNILSYLVFKLRLIKRLFEQISYTEKRFFYMTLKNLF